MFKGLSDVEVINSRKKYGTNEIITKNKNSFLKLLIESLGDPIIKILLIALGVKIIFLFHNFDWYETIGILIAVFLASVISSISEYGSNKAFENLQKEYQMIKCKVIRNSKIEEIYFKDVVVGDLVQISSGDSIPADGIVINGKLSIDESSITGENREIIKKINDKVYSGTVNYKDTAIIKITSVGKDSFIGNISKQLQMKDEKSPLKQKLTVLAKQISKLGYFGAVLSSLTFLFVKIVVDNNFNLILIKETITNFSLMMDYFIYCLTLSVSIIIMAVPEGLPMMITLVLSSNMKKMLKDNVLVRKLVGIETSGDLNVLLCDKTGTLTEGKLKLEKIITYDNSFENENELFNSKNYEIIMESLLLNNESKYNSNGIIGGNITDKAILEFFTPKLSFLNKKVLDKTLFSSNTKFSSVTVENGLTYYKGASEVLLDKCHGYIDNNGNYKLNFNKQQINNLVEKYTKAGFRVLVNLLKKDNITYFISILIIADTIRKQTISSIKNIKKAGIKVIMITGDSKNTALTIAKKINLYDYGDYILTHDELTDMSDESILKIIDKISIIARALPEDKKRLVSLFKMKNYIVGMTGDGVNDALALKKSDVSFAMGSGCEVAKEASDIVILDNDISSIYKAILYGRTIFKSIRKFIIYQLTVNICALIISILGVVIGVATPITIIQMLWLNMIMDTFAGLAFSFEPPLTSYMEEKPKNKDEKIINNYMKNEIIINGITSAIICLLFLKLSFVHKLFRYDPNDIYLLTGFFALFIFMGIINSFLARTHELNILKNVLKNKIFLIINTFIIIVQLYIIYYGHAIFRAYGLTYKELIFTILISLIIIPIDFFRKLLLIKHKKNVGV